MGHNLEMLGTATLDTMGGLVTNCNPQDLPEGQPAALATKGDVLIFVSFSMPEKSVQQWFEQAKKIHAPLVLRGLVHDSLQDTQARLTPFMSSNEGGGAGIIIDPRLFTEYGITRVPAVVVRNTSQACLDETCTHTYPFHVVYGDVGLDAALKEIDHRTNEDGSHVATNLRETGQGST